LPKKKEKEEKLELEIKSGWLKIKAADRKKIMKFAEDYKKFLSEVKTEREAVDFFVRLAEKNGFENLENKKKLKPGDKVYLIHREKTVGFAVIGKKSMAEGMNFVVAHIDSPRIDLKPHPIIEDKESSLCVFKTQYYGGIKKYQWLSRPLELRGVICKKDGEKIKVRIGYEDGIYFIIPDLLPHLARKVQGERKPFEIVQGEEMLAVVGNIPVENEKENTPIKKNVLKILYQKYGIKEEDLISADLSLVPAERPMDVGLDGSMIGAYGQDDRICAYASFRAILDLYDLEKTAVVILYDKEETGSDGDTGAKSAFLDYFITTLMKKSDGNFDYHYFLEGMKNSRAISADVDAVINPAFKQVHDIPNAAKLGHGVVITKYTGAGGKYSTSEAHAEYMAFIRKILDDAGVIYQIGTLGKVDYGGGGTIAKYFAEYGMNVVDMGPGILGMHSPYEISSKLDLYQAYLAYRAFLRAI